MSKSMVSKALAVAAFAAGAAAQQPANPLPGMLYEFRAAWSAGGTVSYNSLEQGVNQVPKTDAGFVGSVTVTFGPGEHCFAAAFDYDLSAEPVYFPERNDRIDVIPSAAALGTGQSYLVADYVIGGIQAFVNEAVTDCHELNNEVRGGIVGDRVMAISQHISVPDGQTGSATIVASRTPPGQGHFGAVFRHQDVDEGLDGAVYIYTQTDFGSDAPGHCGDTTTGTCGASSAVAESDGNCVTINFSP